MDLAGIIRVDSEVVGCDGGGGALGHPLVYLHIGKDGANDCPYCGRRFVLTPAPAAAVPVNQS